MATKQSTGTILSISNLFSPWIILHCKVIHRPLTTLHLTSYTIAHVCKLPCLFNVMHGSMHKFHNKSAKKLGKLIAFWQEKIRFIMFSFNSPTSQTKVRSPLSALKQMEEDLTYWFLSLLIPMLGFFVFVVSKLYGIEAISTNKILISIYNIPKQFAIWEI